MEGYLLAKGDIRTLHAKLTYDYELSSLLGIGVFWFDGEITPHELDACAGVAFSLDDIIMSGLKMAKSVLDKKTAAS